MTTTDLAARFARERQEADGRYNRALTALDRAVADVSTLPAFDAGKFAALTTALIVFLQQITLFVESKDREIVANADARQQDLDRSLAQVSELRTQMSVVQRAIQALTRSADAASGSNARTERPESSSSTAAAPGPDFKYVAFEDAFRGSPAIVAERVGAYVPVFGGARDVVDLGCGRGELLTALRDHGIQARGVDASADMAAIARERGLDAVHGDALGFLNALPDESLGGVIATQVIEHFEPAYLLRLIDTASHKLRRGAPIVLETINVACWLAFFGYLRDFTHVRPVHPETLQYLLRANGFERVEIRYSAPVPDTMKLRTFDVPPELAAAADPALKALAGLAQTVNVNAVILNNLMFTHLDYAGIGYRA